MYTLPELIERRKILQESIDSWQNFVTELRAVQPHLEAQAQSALPEASTAPPAQSEESWTVKYQRAQSEIKRREDLLLRLNQAIIQYTQSPDSIPTPEQFAALATYMPPALDKARFDVAYARFCQGKSIQMNTSIIMPDVSRPVIDVYSLHVAVMQEGSFARVSHRVALFPRAGLIFVGVYSQILGPGWGASWVRPFGCDNHRAGKVLARDSYPSGEGVQRPSSAI